MQPSSLSPRPQSKKQRLMRKDFAGGGAARRDNRWASDARGSVNPKAQTFLEAKDLNNTAFEEYYKKQVGQELMLLRGRSWG